MPREELFPEEEDFEMRFAILLLHPANGTPCATGTLQPGKGSTVPVVALPIFNFKPCVGGFNSRRGPPHARCSISPPKDGGETAVFECGELYLSLQPTSRPPCAPPCAELLEVTPLSLREYEGELEDEDYPDSRWLYTYAHKEATGEVRAKSTIASGE